MSVLPSGVAASREITFVWPSSFAMGFGASPPAFSWSSHTRICPRLFPAATRRCEPTSATAVVQSASHGRVHACVGLVRSGMVDDQSWQSRSTDYTDDTDFKTEEQNRSVFWLLGF